MRRTKNKLRTQLRDALEEIERLKIFVTEKSTKRLDAEKRLSEWEDELNIKIKEAKESTLAEFEDSSEYHDLKAILSIEAYMVGQESFHVKVEVCPLEWDLSFLCKETSRAKN